MSTDARRRSLPTKRIVGVALMVALLVAMVLDTKFLTPQEAAKLNPAAFNAETYAKENFPKVTAAIKQKATDIAVLAPAVQADLPAAGKKNGQDLGSNAYSFPVKATGTATEVDTNFVQLTVPGVPAGTTVRIPVGPAVSGTPVRDCTGEIKFGDFVGQTDYQSVANQFKLRIQQDVVAKVDPASMKGKQVTVYGAWSTGGPPKSFVIQPVEITVAS
jgi:predicted lipoprotein